MQVMVLTMSTWFWRLMLASALAEWREHLLWTTLTTRCLNSKDLPGWCWYTSTICHPCKWTLGVLMRWCPGAWSIVLFEVSNIANVYTRAYMGLHGLWCRLSTLICYFFYKNLLFTICIFLFNCQCSWSGQFMFNEWGVSLYNTMWVLSWWDSECWAVVLLLQIHADASASVCNTRAWCAA